MGVDGEDDATPIYSREEEEAGHPEGRNNEPSSSSSPRGLANHSEGKLTMRNSAEVQGPEQETLSNRKSRDISSTSGGKMSSILSTLHPKEEGEKGQKNISTTTSDIGTAWDGTCLQSDFKNETICGKESGSFGYSVLKEDDLPSAQNGQKRPRKNSGEKKRKDNCDETRRGWTLGQNIHFLVVVSVLKFFLFLSVFIILTGTLSWFHMRLSALERVAVMNQPDSDRFSGQRNSENNLPPFPDSGEEDVINDARNGGVVSSPPEIMGSASRTSDNENGNGQLPWIRKIRVRRRVEASGQRGRSSNPNLSNYNVEFINPKGREDGGGAGDRGGGPDGQPIGADGNPLPDDDWVWLTSYSRIPLNAIQEFCSATKEYCPPGQKGDSGPPGKAGNKGERGDRGGPGDPGSRGPQGPPGFPGLRGEPGLPGMDGRDGLPGEPGLDGIPGRSGLDGVPGVDGIPGMPGRPGTNGTNGQDGLPGPQGSHGPHGPRGIPGPAGKVGPSGTPGRDGIPGINAWMYNGTNRQQLLIPPSIVGVQTKARPLAINEGDMLRLSCMSTGVPRPSITWKRADGAPIRLGAWKSSGIEGPVLNLTRINREHMGEYVCVADNGVTPWQQRSFTVEVYFSPMIRIQTQMLGVSLGSVATLECFVEAFPIAVTYWERSDGRILENGDKYKISTKESAMYKILLTLNVTRVTSHDLGRYYCVAKSELGITKADFTLYEVDPSLATPQSKSGGGKGVAVYGQTAPDHKDLEDLCPQISTPQPCPECIPKVEPGIICRSGGFALLDMVGWEIYPLGNLTTPAPTNRTQDCVLSAVGKPVFNRYSNVSMGCWMKDPVPLGSPAPAALLEKYWVTRIDDTTHLYEYHNKTSFTRHHSTRTYTLPFPFRGNFHTVYNGSFFYVTESKEGQPKIVRLDLFSGKSSGDMELPYASFSADKLYSSEHSWVDLATDENGLWAIHSLPGSNNTAILKIQVDQDSMMIVYGWNVTISHTYAGDMFVICGVLYAVDSVSERDTKIRLALDLYRRQLLRVDLPFSNPFRHTSMVSYNPRTKELFTWDRGNQLIYPVKYTDIGYDKEDKHEELYGLPVTFPPPSNTMN